MITCNICHKELGTNAYTEDCGGDCLSCRADAGDPDCMKQLILSLREDMTLLAYIVVDEYPSTDCRYLQAREIADRAGLDMEGRL